MLLVVVMAFISCDDDNGPQYESGNLITWDVVTTDIPVGRALIDKNEELNLACSTGKSIGIKSSYILDGKVSQNVLGNPDGDVSLTYSKTPVTEHLNGWSYGQTAAYWELGAKYTFNAYYPMDITKNGNDITTSDNSPFVIRHNAKYNQEDLMMTYATVNTESNSFSTSSPVVLKMQHMLSALTFRFSFQNRDNTTFAATDTLTAFSLKNTESNKGIYTYGKLEFGIYNTDGTLDGDSIHWTNISGAVNPGEKIYEWTGISPMTSTNGTVQTGGVLNYAIPYSSGNYSDNDTFILLIPQEIDGTTQVCYQLKSTDNTEHSFILPNVTYLPGKRYHYDIHISSTDIEVSLTIADWNKRYSSVIITP